MSDNPFHSPSVLETSTKPVGDTNLDGVVEVLRGTRPWVRLISVLLFVGATLGGLGGAFALAAGPSDLSLGVFGGLIYLVVSLIYFVPALFLWTYANRISSFEIERTETSLRSALQPQKWFWTFVGVIATVSIVFYLGVFAFGIVAILSM